MGNTQGRGNDSEGIDHPLRGPAETPPKTWKSEKGGMTVKVDLVGKAEDLIVIQFLKELVAVKETIDVLKQQNAYLMGYVNSAEQRLQELERRVIDEREGKNPEEEARTDDKETPSRRTEPGCPSDEGTYPPG